MDPVVIESRVGDTCVKCEERRRRRERRKQEKNAARIRLQTQETLEAPKLDNGDAENIPLEKNLTTQPLGGHPKDPGAAETPSEVHAMDPVGDNSEELEKRRQRKERRQAKKAARIIIQTHKPLEDSRVANVNLEKIILEKDVTAPPLGENPKMDPGSAEIPLEGHALDPMVIERSVGDNSEKYEEKRQKTERKKQAKKAEDITIQTHSNLEDSNVTNCSSEKILLEKDVTAQRLGGNPKMDPGSTETPLEGRAMAPMIIDRPVGDNSEKHEKKRQKKERKKHVKKAEHITIQTHSTLEDYNVANCSSEKISLEKDLTAQPLDGNPKMVSGSAETFLEDHAMASMVIERPAGDNSEKLEQKRQEKERKEAKKAEHITIQTHSSLEDSNVANGSSEKIILGQDVTAQPLGGNPKMDPGSAETPLEGRAMAPMVIESSVGDSFIKHEEKRQKKERKKQAKKAEDITTHSNLEDSNVTNCSSEKILLEKDVTAQRLGGNRKMDPGSTEIPLEGRAMVPMIIDRPVGDNSEKHEKKRQKKERKKHVKKAEHITIQTHSTLEDYNVANCSSEKISVEKDLTAQPLDGNPKMVSGSAETFLEDHAMASMVIERPAGDNSEKLEKKSQEKERKEAKKAEHITIQTHSTLEDSNVANGSSEKILLGQDVTAQPLGGNPKMDPGSAETPLEGRAMAIERSVGDSSVKHEEKRQKKERKKQAKKAEHITIQTHSTLEDSNVTNCSSEKILLEKDVTVQPLGGNPKMDPGSAETPLEGRAMAPMIIERPVGDTFEKHEKKREKKERKKQAKKADHITTQAHSTLEDYNVANCSSEKISLEKDLTAQPLDGNPKMVSGSAETFLEDHAMTSMVIERPSGDNSEKLEKKRQEKERKEFKKAEHITIQTHSTLEDSNVANGSSEKILLEKGVTAQPLGGNPKLDPGSAETPLEGRAMAPMVIERSVGDHSEKHKEKRQKKERKQAKKAEHITIQTHSTLEDSNVANGSSEKIFLEKDLTAQPLDGNPKMDSCSAETPSDVKKKNKTTTNEEEANGSLEKILLEPHLTAQTLFGNPKVDLGSEESPEGHVKNIRKKNMKKETHEEEGQTKIDVGPTKNLVEGNVTGKKKRKRMKKTTIEDEPQNTPQTGSTENVVEGDGTNERKMKRNKTMKEETKDVTTNVSSSDVKNAECLFPLNGQITSTRRRKLLVLDLNGVLADIVRPPVPKEIRRGTKSIFGQAIIKRPFYDDFLNFCFENFDVGIWSSRSRNRVPRIVDYLLGDLQWKLVFCWDMTHVTPTGFKTLDNRKKPLVLKEIRKIWDNNDPGLGWKKGDYDQSNTLLLDDSPFKALLNPVHTAIFPNSYCYWQKDDNSLGPGGDLRVYLEGLLASENVQDYVEQNPFGQHAITKQDPSWGFYERVINCVSSRLKNQHSFSRGW